MKIHCKHAVYIRKPGNWHDDFGTDLLDAGKTGERGAQSMLFFICAPMKKNITSFSISSQDYVLENGTEEAVIKAFVENEWKIIQALQRN